jgi:ABC-type branched-subunit amino acid transport system ATPase component
MPELLRVRGLRAGYGESVVIDGIDLSLDEGQSLALLGRNGTGKTTLLATLVGVTRYRGGSIELDGRAIAPLRADQRAAAGLGWVPQERNIWKSLTVEENLTAVARTGPWTRRACSSCSRVCASVAAISARSSPAASSRCSPSAARWCSIRVFCFSTSRWKAWRR